VSHSSDAFYFYCTTRNRVIICRDVKWLDWHGTSALDEIKHLMENENIPNDSRTGGTVIELLHDSDEEDDQLWRDNATSEPIAQSPAGRSERPAGREEPPAGREEPPAGRNEKRVAAHGTCDTKTFFNPIENATETVLQVSLSSHPGTPRNDKEAKTCKERELRKEGRAKEYDNFSKAKEYDNYSKREAWQHMDRGSVAPTKRSWERRTSTK
jgi:hypothetical protein